MRALRRFTFSIFFLVTVQWITGLNVVHSASCPEDGAFAGIKIWHHLQSTAYPFYTQTTEYMGTVGIGFANTDTYFSVYMAGNDIISKTVEASQESLYWNCFYDTAQVKVEVTISSNETTCTDGVLNLKIIEEAEAATVDYHCVDGQGNVYLFEQTYPVTRLEHNVMIEYEHEAMQIHSFAEGTGSYSWTLLFRETPVPPIDDDDKIHLVPLITPLLLQD